MSIWGAVDRRGQQKYSVCNTRGPYQMILSIMKQIFFKDSLCLRVAQMPRSRDLAIFVPMTMMTMTTTDGQTGCFTPCACAWGNNIVWTTEMHSYLFSLAI